MLTQVNLVCSLGPFDPRGKFFRVSLIQTGLPGTADRVVMTHGLLCRIKYFISQSRAKLGPVGMVFATCACVKDKGIGPGPGAGFRGKFVRRAGQRLDIGIYV